MNVNYAKFQKRLIVEQFQGNYLKLRIFVLRLLVFFSSIKIIIRSLFYVIVFFTECCAQASHVTLCFYFINFI